MLSCIDVANYFLVLVDREAGDLITQLKLQKLVYFAQGISLRFLEKPLFPELIEAWDHGPVVRDLRRTFGKYEDRDIPEPSEIDFDLYSVQDKRLIYKVYAEYGEHSASYLRNLTHEHSIWQEAHEHESQIISLEKMKVFFKGIDLHENFLCISEQDDERIEQAEDEWWMRYDSGVPSEDLTQEIAQA